jgi:hypothetical protein
MVFVSIILFFSCHIVTVASCKSPSVTEDILAPVKSHQQFKEHAGPTLLYLIEIAEFQQRLGFFFGGGGLMLKGHIVTCVENVANLLCLSFLHFYLYG